MYVSSLQVNFALFGFIAFHCEGIFDATKPREDPQRKMKELNLMALEL